MIQDNYKIYINKFTSSTEVQAALDDGTLNNPYVALIETESGSSIDYNTDEPTDYSKEYFTIEMMSNGQLHLTGQEGFYYSKNEGVWTACNSDRDTYISDLVIGDKVRFKGDYRKRNSTFWQCNDNFKVYGNLMSLIYEDNFTTATTMPTQCFMHTFWKSSVVDASNLIFPNFTEQQCYLTMFWDAKKLAYGPKVLPAADVNTEAYQSMFDACSNLISAPVIGAISVITRGMKNMFQNCSKLNYVNCHNIISLTGSNPTIGWMNGVAATGTFVKNANMSSWPTGADGIPTGWTVQDAQ